MQARRRDGLNLSGGYARFEFSRAIDGAQLDRAATRLPYPAPWYPPKPIE